MGVAYNVGANRISAFTVYVDDKIQYSRMFTGADSHGIQYLELDTRTIPDGNHTIKVIAMGARGVLASDAVDIVIRNGVPGGLDLVPPLVQFRNLQDGQVVRGELTVDLLAEDNAATQDLLVSIFVNRQSVFIKNRPPYTMKIDTAQYLDPKTGTGLIQLEAWAYDASNNLGKSRMLTLQVRAAGASEDQTRARPNPLLAGRTPVLSTPDMSARGLAPLPVGANATLTLPLLPRTSQPPVVVGAAPQPMVRSGRGGLVARNNPMPLNPDAAPNRSAARAGLPSRRNPFLVRSDLRLDGAAMQPLPPALLPNREPGRRLPGARVTMPDPPMPRAQAVAGPAAQPVKPAAAQPPAVKPPAAKPVAAKPAPVKPVAAKPAPQTIARNPAAVPAPTIQDGIGTEPTREPMVAVVNPQARPNRDGKIPVALYRAPLPRDRDYRFKPGDTLRGVAHRFKVSPRSILVANALTSSRSIRPGRRIRVPGTFDVMVDNRRVAFDVTPRVESGLALAPFRQIFEHAGGLVVYYPTDQMVRAANERTEVKLKIGSKEAIVDQLVVVMDREAFIESGRTLVPISFMERVLDLKAEYDVKSGTISLVHK
jgi:LysM repeat protein